MSSKRLPTMRRKARRPILDPCDAGPNAPGSSSLRPLCEPHYFRCYKRLGLESLPASLAGPKTEAATHCHSGRQMVVSGRPDAAFPVAVILRKELMGLRIRVPRYGDVPARSLRPRSQGSFPKKSMASTVQRISISKGLAGGSAFAPALRISGPEISTDTARALRGVRSDDRESRIGANAWHKVKRSSESIWERPTPSSRSWRASESKGHSEPGRQPADAQRRRLHR